MRLVNEDTGEEVSQLSELAKPFPSNLVERVEGNEYVAHHIITQRLLSVVGPFDFKLVELVRGDVPGRKPDPTAKSKRGQQGTPTLSGVVVAAIYRLVCEVDGRRTEVEEVGECGDPHNWAHDGARLKDAASDALKRCAMRLGLALHLWSQEHYFLHTQLAAQTRPPQQQPPRPSPIEDEMERRHQRGRQPALTDAPDPAWAGKDGRQ